MGLGVSLHICSMVLFHHTNQQSQCAQNDHQGRRQSKVQAPSLPQVSDASRNWDNLWFLYTLPRTVPRGRLQIQTLKLLVHPPIKRLIFAVMGRWEWGKLGRAYFCPLAN